MEWKWNGASVKNIIKLSEVESYIDKFKDSTFKMAISVLLCIMSPAVLIVLSGISEGTGAISEKASDIAGICVIILMAAIAVYMFVRSLMELGKNDIAGRSKNEGAYTLEQSAQKYVSDLKLKQKKIFSSGVINGIIVCVIAAIPVVVTGMFFENIALYECIATAVFLVVFAIEAACFIYCQLNWNCYDRL